MGTEKGCKLPLQAESPKEEARLERILATEKRVPMNQDTSLLSQFQRSVPRATDHGSSEPPRAYYTTRVTTHEKRDASGAHKKGEGRTLAMVQLPSRLREGKSHFHRREREHDSKSQHTALPRCQVLSDSLL